MEEGREGDISLPLDNPACGLGNGNARLPADPDACGCAPGVASRIHK